MSEEPFVTRADWEEHLASDWRIVHGIWPHARGHIPSEVYSKAEIDAFFEGEDAGKKQVDWARITSKPGTFPPSVHAHVKADITDTPWAWGDVSKTGSNLTDLATRQHAGLTGLGDDDHTQYHNDTRGDARYFRKTEFIQTSEGELDAGKPVKTSADGMLHSSLISAHTHDDRYYTETELNNGQLDNIYFGEDEFLVTSAGSGDSGKPIKLNAAGLVDNTMLTTKEPVISAGTTAQYWRGDKTWQALAGSHSHDDLYYTESEVDTKLALQDTLAEMDDTLIVSPEDGEFLVWDADSPPSGKWICTTQLPSHTHDDRYYTETELNNGQLDNIYFGEDEFLATTAGVGDAGKPIKLNAAGLVDNTMTALCDADKVDGEHASAIVTDARVKAHFPDTIANILSNHTLAVHNALTIDHGSLGGKGDDDHTQYYNATRHTVAIHDALNINADRLDTYHHTSFMKIVGGIFTGGVTARDHGTAAIDEIVNVCYGIGEPPVANTTTIGTLYVKYTN